MAEMPHLVQVAADFARQGGSVVGISEDLFVPSVTPAQALERAQKLADRQGITFPVLVLEDETLDPLNERFGLPGPIPITLAFDASGKEVDRQEGPADAARLHAMMRRALGDTVPPK